MMFADCSVLAEMKGKKNKQENNFLLVYSISDK